MEFEGNICPALRVFGNVFPSACGAHPAVVWSRVLLFLGQNLAVNEDRASQGLSAREKQDLGSLALSQEWNPEDFPSRAPFIPMGISKSPFSLSWRPPFTAIIPVEGWEYLGNASVHYKEQINFLSIPIPLLPIPSFLQGR